MAVGKIENRVWGGGGDKKVGKRCLNAVLGVVYAGTNIPFYCSACTFTCKERGCQRHVYALGIYPYMDVPTHAE